MVWAGKDVVGTENARYKADGYEEPDRLQERIIEMMSNRILTAVILAAVSLHVLLGCCWHHGHQCETGVMTAEASCESCPFHDDHSKSSDNESHDDQHNHGTDCCDGASCNFYSPNDSSIELSSAPAVRLSVTDANGFAGVLASMRETNCGEVSINPGFAASEPLHALKQVWVI